VLILDGITDPHNLGAILRSCDQFAVDMVIIPERRSVQANETVIKISSGAAQYVPLAPVININREIDLLKDNGFWVYGADMNGDSSYETKYANRTVIIMGNEGSGISRLSREKCDFISSIPMTGHIDSLNVSVAAGILLYEVRRSVKK
jgi:23S rRNA (guanosine2251-2'-O)-methyltransferase